MAAGINDLVEQKVNAYRGNPQQLMQRYQQNQELVDLLALQKMKSEKEAAARDMQMKMQQNPQTIAQQREQEVLGLTKNELAQQTAGIMQQRQKQQQQGLQRMAKAAGGAPGGLAGLAPQGGPPAPRRMAGGGIVAFQEGGSTDREALEQKKRDIMQQMRFRRNDPELSRQLREINAQLGAFGPTMRTDMPEANFYGSALANDPYLAEREARQSRPATGLMAGRSSAPTEAAPQATPTAAPSVEPQTGPTPTEGLAGLDAGRGLFPKAGEKLPPAANGDITLDQVVGGSFRDQQPAPQGPADVQVPEAAGVPRLGRLGDIYERIAGQDISKVGEAAAETARKGYQGIVSGMEKRLDDFKREGEKLYDPESERLDRLIAFATGAGGQATGAGALAAGGKGSLSLRKEQRDARMERNKEILNMAKDIDLTKIGIEKDVQARVSDALSRATSQVNSAMQAAATISSAEASRADAAADRILNAAGINAKLESDRADRVLQQARNVIADRQASATERAAAARALSAELATLTQLDQRLEQQAEKEVLSIDQQGELNALRQSVENALPGADLNAAYQRIAELENMARNGATSAGSKGDLDIQQRILDITAALEQLSNAGR